MTPPIEKCNIENCNEAEEEEEEVEEEGEEEAEKEETWQELMGNDLLLQVRSFVRSFIRMLFVCCFGAENKCMYLYSKCLIPFFCRLLPSTHDPLDPRRIYARVHTVVILVTTTVIVIVLVLVLVLVLSLPVSNCMILS